MPRLRFWDIRFDVDHQLCSLGYSLFLGQILSWGKCVLQFICFRWEVYGFGVVIYSAVGGNFGGSSDSKVFLGSCLKCRLKIFWGSF